MPQQRYEYRVEPLSIAPDELENERYEFEDTLNEAASDGWMLEDTLRIDSSTVVFVFGRSVDSSQEPS